MFNVYWMHDQWLNCYSFVCFELDDGNLRNKHPTNGIHTTHNCNNNDWNRNHLVSKHKLQSVPIRFSCQWFNMLLFDIIYLLRVKQYCWINWTRQNIRESFNLILFHFNSIISHIFATYSYQSNNYLFICVVCCCAKNCVVKISRSCIRYLTRKIWAHFCGKIEV